MVGRPQEMSTAAEEMLHHALHGRAALTRNVLMDVALVPPA